MEARQVVVAIQVAVKRANLRTNVDNMTPGRWQQLKTLYEAATRLDPEEWDDFILAACLEDQDLALNLRQLLRHMGDSSLLDHPLISLSPGSEPLRMPHTFDSGQLVAGRFEIVTFLGQGGMGEVYKAYDRQLQEDVALKTLRGDASESSGMLERLRQEVSRSRRISHPNVCRVYDLFNHSSAGDSTVWFLTMQLLVGPTLADVLREHGPMPPHLALPLARQMLSALGAAHSAGIVHRDFKPGNVILVDFDTGNRHAAVTDFGLAVEHFHSDAADQSQTIVGTPDYMAPERFRGVATAASDLYSFGVVLFEMLTGDKPHRAQLEQFDSLCPDSRNRLAKMPRQFRSVVTRCLETNPQQRFGKVEEVLATLPRFWNEDGTRTRRGISKSLAGISMMANGAIQFSQTLRGLGVVSVGLVAVALSCAAIYRITRPVPFPRLTDPVQITNDGIPKLQPLLTDGSRLFFNTSLGPRQVSVNGGETLPFDVPVKDALLERISPDRTELLLCRYRDASDGCELWISPLVGGAARRLGSFLARHPAVDWSPDGRQLVYAQDKALHIITRDGVQIRQIVTPMGEPGWVRWSPDGTRLRFFVPPNAAGSIWDAAIDGTQVSPVLPGWNTSWLFCCGNWTPDGKYFLFAAGRFKDFDRNIWALGENAGWIRPLHRDPFQLTSAPLETNWPVPGLDGKRLFVEGRQPRNQFLLYDLESGHMSAAFPGISGTDLEYSRDQKWVAYVTVPDGALWRSAADGSQRLQLAPAFANADMPRWSPDGKKIAFSRAHPGSPDRIDLVGLDGSSLEQVTNGEAGPRGDRDPSWSPDGTALVFGSAWPGSRRDVTLHVLDLKTRGVSSLPGSEGLWSPRWSPGEALIAAIAEPGSRVVVYDVSTHKRWPVSQTPGGYPSWSKDGKYLFYRTGSGSVAWWRVHVPDWKTERVADLSDIPVIEWFVPAQSNTFLTAREVGTDEIYSLEWILP
jgi:serine/threonine protein kinase/Tol biopolymer transport system component